MSDEPNTTDEIKAALYGKLAVLGIATVLIDYDGSADSGCIDSIVAIGPDGKNIRFPDSDVQLVITVSRWNAEWQMWVETREVSTVPLRKAIESWCYDLLEQHFSGWANDDGACGHIELNVAEQTGCLTHPQRYTDYTVEDVEV